METSFNKKDVMAIVESLMEETKDSVEKGESVYMKDFFSSILKHRTEKNVRNISQNTTIIIPAHNIPAFSLRRCL